MELRTITRRTLPIGSVRRESHRSLWQKKKKKRQVTGTRRLPLAQILSRKHARWKVFSWRDDLGTDSAHHWPVGQSLFPEVTWFIKAACANHRSNQFFSSIFNVDLELRSAVNCERFKSPGTESPRVSCWASCLLLLSSSATVSALPRCIPLRAVMIVDYQVAARLQVTCQVRAKKKKFSLLPLGVSWLRAGPRLTPRCGQGGHARSLAYEDERVSASPWLPLTWSASPRSGFALLSPARRCSCATWKLRPSLRSWYPSTPASDVVGNEETRRARVFPPFPLSSPCLPPRKSLVAR